jgi:ribosomal-protein-alanine N-acetyltransferase
MLTLNFTPFPVIETERLVLRNITHEDVADVFEIRSNPETMRYIPRPIAQTLDDAKAIIDMILGFTSKNERINWAMTEKGSNKLIGIIGYVNTNQDSNRAEIGYVINNDYQRKGYMYEALLATVKYGFDMMSVHTIEAVIRTENTPSVQLVEKAGFTREAMFRDYINFNGYHDAYVYTLINPAH